MQDPDDAVEESIASETVTDVENFSIQVIDDCTEEPIGDVSLIISLPDGSTQTLATNADGRIELANIEPGRIVVMTDVRGLQMKDTLALLSTGYLSTQWDEDGERDTVEGTVISADDLTQFNWGTTDPDEVGHHLQIDVGAMGLDDNNDLVFSADDIPGLLSVPLPLRLTTMRLSHPNILRVGKPESPYSFVFSI